MKKPNKLAQISTLINQATASAASEAEAKIAKRSASRTEDVSNVGGGKNVSNASSVKDAGSAPRKKRTAKSVRVKNSGSNANNVSNAKSGTNVSNVTNSTNAKSVTAQPGKGGGLVRFQGYFKAEEVEAIQQAQSAFIAAGFQAPPLNQIVRIALLTLKVDDEAVGQLVRIKQQKRQRQ